MGWYDDFYSVHLEDLIGRTIVEISGISDRSDVVNFICSDGTEYRMMHHQDCCESVSLEEVIGDCNDLIGSPIVVSEESTSSGNCDYDSCTWTFYRFATVRGWVYLRWYGSSNGYYGEGVSFEKKKGPEPVAVDYTTGEPVKKADTNWPDTWGINPGFSEKDWKSSTWYES